MPNARITKKILRNRKHPLRQKLVSNHIASVEDYAQNECRRLELNPANWSQYALRWPAHIARRIAHLKVAK